MRSLVEYGCEIKYSFSVKALKILQSVHVESVHVESVSVYGPRDMYINATNRTIQHECGEPLLHIRRSEIMMRHTIRIKACNNNPAVLALDDIWHNYIPRYIGKNVKSIISPVQTTRLHNNKTSTVNATMVDRIANHRLHTG
jgi:hypothetical protein